MKNKSIFLILLGILILASSCSPTLQTNQKQAYEPLPLNTPVVAFSPNELVPQNAIKIDQFFFNLNLSDFEEMSFQIATLRNKARKVGANAVRISEVQRLKNIDFIQIKIELFQLDNVFDFLDKDTTINTTNEEASLFIFRLRQSNEEDENYNLLFNNEEIAVLQNNTNHKIVVPEGQHTLAIKDNDASEISFTAEKNKAYYIHIYTNKSNKPEIKLRSPFAGRFLYEFIDSMNAEILKIENLANQLTTEDDAEGNKKMNTETENDLPSSETVKPENLSQNPQIRFSEPVKNSSLDFRIALSGGYGYRGSLADINLSSSQNDLRDDLRLGFVFDLNTALYFDDKNGVGLKFNRFTSDASRRESNFPASGFTNRTVSNTLTSFAATYNRRVKYSKNRNELHIGAGLGYFRFLDETRLGNRNAETSIEAFGLILDMSYDFFLAENLFLGIQTTFFLGSSDEEKRTNDLGETTIIDLGDNPESFNTSNLLIGLRYIIN